MSEKIRCEFCGKETEEINKVDGHYCCDSCLENKELFIKCPEYDDYVYKPLAVPVYDASGNFELWCPEAAESRAVRCACCNKYYRPDYHMHDSPDGLICDTCVSQYVECQHCGRLFRRSEMSDVNCRYCIDSCNSEKMQYTIHRYGYKPLLNFYGDEENIYMGIELESGKAPSYDDMNNTLKALLREDQEEHFVFKSDSSIPGNGCELVSHPMTLKYHKEYKWKEIFNELEDKAKLKPCRGCGLHVHINRTATNNWNWHKIDAFINNFREFSEMIAGRPQSTYAEFYDVSCRRKSAIAAMNRYSRSTGHGTAVNTGNRNTVEIRIFQATFDIEELYARLEFVHALVNHSNNISAANVTNKDVKEINKFVEYVNKHADKYENLVKYLSKHFSK